MCKKILGFAPKKQTNKKFAVSTKNAAKKFILIAQLTDIFAANYISYLKMKHVYKKWCVPSKKT